MNISILDCSSGKEFLVCGQSEFQRIIRMVMLEISLFTPLRCTNLERLNLKMESTVLLVLLSVLVENSQIARATTLVSYVFPLSGYPPCSINHHPRQILVTNHQPLIVPLAVVHLPKSF
jgi:hypothetical protein